MSELDKFANIFQRRLESTKQAQLRFVVCKSVDWNERTMFAVGVSDDVGYEGVQLGFGYMDIKPAKDSVCLIGILEGKESLTFLINAENVELVEITASDTITINGGNNDGIVKVVELTDKINTIEKDINALKQVFAGWTTAPNDGGAALKAAAATWFADMLQITNKSEIENDKIKH